jgi:hypothetical protein
MVKINPPPRAFTSHEENRYPAGKGKKVFGAKI